MEFSFQICISLVLTPGLTSRTALNMSGSTWMARGDVNSTGSREFVSVPDYLNGGSGITLMFIYLSFALLPIRLREALIIGVLQTLVHICCVLYVHHDQGKQLIDSDCVIENEPWITTQVSSSI